MMTYAAIEVYRLLSGGSKQHIPNAEVKIYKAADDSLLATVNADAGGIVWPVTLSVPPGTPVYYEYIEASVHYRGGQGVTTEFLYQDIVVAADPHESFYPDGNVEPVAVEVYVRDSASPNAAWRLHDRYAPTATASIPVTVAQDRPIDIRVVSIAPDGTRSVSEISHAPGQTVSFQLISAPCVIGQAGASEETSAVIAVTDVPPEARARRIRTFSDAAATAVLDIYFNQSPLPGTEILPGSAGETIYVRVAHSGTAGTSGPWSPESNILAITFATSGSGGSSGDFDPYGRGLYV